MDAVNRKLYLSRSTHVMVVDLESEKIVGEIPNTPAVHGIAFVPELNRGFTSNGGDSSVTVFDLKTLKTLGNVKASGTPDIIMFEPVSRRVLSFNHRTNNITAIDPDTMKAVGTLAAGGVPELAVSDDKGHVWVNLEDKSEILHFNAKTLEVVKKFPLAPGEEPTGSGVRPEDPQPLQHMRQQAPRDFQCGHGQGRSNTADRPRPRRLRSRRGDRSRLRIERRRWHGRGHS